MSKSEDWVKRLRAVMPWGSSTCSKAATLLPDEPGVIVRGKGCRVWDADGREFIDYRNALGPISLGYQFPATDQAIRGQLDSGVIFGHPHPIECEVAEMLSEAIPCAERVRFLKTGGEAVAACIRLARCHTGRDHVVQIGYNGWLNSLAGAGAALLPRASRPGLLPREGRRPESRRHCPPSTIRSAGTTRARSRSCSRSTTGRSPPSSSRRTTRPWPRGRPSTPSSAN